VTVADLAWLLVLPLWQKDRVRFQVNPRQVRADPARLPDHLRPVIESDLAHPIHLVEHRGRLVVLDGFHRLLKANTEDRPRVSAVVLSEEDLESLC
jgi:hypothetical protein